MVFSSAIKTWLLILFSFCGGLVLMVLTLPVWLNWLQLPWVVLVLLYWALMMPQYVNVGAACLLGFFLDIIYDVPLGVHALILVVITYFMIKFREEFIQLGFGKMAIIIFGFVMLYQLLRFLMGIYYGYYFSGWSILSTAVVSALVWPLLALLLFNWQKKFRI